jgi:DNA polymerase III subunit epsilon
MKDKMTAGFLALFLGGVGAHRFYLGQTKLGVLYLVFCWTYIPSLIGFVEGLLFFIRSERDFLARYNPQLPYTVERPYNPLVPTSSEAIEGYNKEKIKPKTLVSATSQKYDTYDVIRDIEALHNAEQYETLVKKYGDTGAVEKLPSSQLPGAYGGIGNAYYKLGEMDAAIAYFLKAYELETYKMSHKRNLLSMYYIAQDYDKVIEWSDKMDLQRLKQEKSWDDFYYGLFKLKGAYEKMGKPEAAINALKLAPLRAQYINTDLQDVFFEMGKLHESIGEEKEALRWYQKLHTAAPQYEGVLECIDRLTANGVKTRATPPKERIGLDFPLTGGIDFTAFDFETANQSRSSACALGVAVVRAGLIIHTQTWLINPQTKSFRFTDIHGITYDMVKDEPHFGELWQEIKPLFKGQRVVAHNGSSFDIHVLYALWEKFNIAPVSVKLVDTLYVSRSKWSHFENHKLGTICNELDIELNHHEAGSDALAAAKILLAAIEDDIESERKYLMAA